LWLNQILHRLKGDKQVFILRRSAGFAYSFLSILRAEPANCKSTLLNTAMINLLNVVESGLDITEVSISNSSICSTQENWKLCVHALNVIRLILCDSAVGPDLNSYISKTTELAVRGFKSFRWGNLIFIIA
jgi:hypothetical protein